MASWWPPHIYQSKSWRNLRISEFRKNSCRPHLHIIAPSTTLRSLTTNSVFLCMWTQGTLQIRSGKFFLLQTSIPIFSSPPNSPLVWGMEASKESLSLAVSSAVRDRCKAKRQKPKAMFSQLVPAGDSNVSLFAGDKPECLPTERQDTWRGTW